MKGSKNVEVILNKNGRQMFELVLDKRGSRIVEVVCGKEGSKRMADPLMPLIERECVKYL